jgi:protein ImuA
MQSHAELNSPGQIVRALAEQVRRLEAGQRPTDVVSTGSQALDDRLADRGLRRGSLVEFLAVPGGGATTLALRAAQQACGNGAALVVMDPEGYFYPPAAAAWGIDLSRILLVRAENRQDEIWALDQALRCSGVAAVICWEDQFDSRTFRRLQLAAETSGALGLLVRSANEQKQPSWAQVRLHVEPLPTSPPTHLATSNRRVQVHILRGYRSGGSRQVELELDEQTGALKETNRLPASA